MALLLLLNVFLQTPPNNDNVGDGSAPFEYKADVVADVTKKTAEPLKTVAEQPTPVSATVAKPKTGKREGMAENLDGAGVRSTPADATANSVQKSAQLCNGPFVLWEQDRGCVRERFDVFLDKQAQMYASVFESPFSAETLAIIEKIRGKRFRAIIIHPISETTWPDEPTGGPKSAGDSFVQSEPAEVADNDNADIGANTLTGDPSEDPLRIHRIMSAFTRRGYLSLFIDTSPLKDREAIREVSPNLFVIHYSLEKHLLPILRTKMVIVLTTSMGQLPFIDQLHHKYIWLDANAALFKFPFRGRGKRVFKDKRIILIHNADLITYSSDLALDQIKDALKRVETAKRAPIPTVSASMANKAYDELAEKIESYIVDNIFSGWKVLANLPDDGIGDVAVMSATFVDSSGRNFFSGGAERYLIDLAELCDRMNLRLTVYQYGKFQWIRRFKDFDVVSLSPFKTTTDDNGQPRPEPSFIEFNRLFYERVVGRSSLNIYSAFFEAFPLAAPPSIGISHGVAWDTEGTNFRDGESFWTTNTRIIKSARQCDKMVSVDTNSANWFQTIEYSLGNNMRVIPNYVDLNQFQPRPNFDKIPNPSKGDRIRIVYPRRLYKPRGLFSVLQVINPILQEYPFVDFHFVGKGYKWDTKHVEKKIRRWRGRIRWYSLPPEFMHLAYRDADISLIPTLWSEGTSLSCLEAMASGNAVIANRVGGLTDLVIDEHNGFLIDPQPDILLQKIKELLNDFEKLVTFKKRAVEVAQAFNKKSWDNKWSDVILSSYDKETEELGSKIHNTLNTTAVPASSVNVPTQKITDRKRIRHPRSPTIEFYLETSPESRDSLKHVILQLLDEFDALVYIRIRTVKESTPESSFGRIQWLGWADESFSSNTIPVVEQSIVDDVLELQLSADPVDPSSADSSSSHSTTTQTDKQSAMARSPSVKEFRQRMITFDSKNDEKASIRTLSQQIRQRLAA